jgi:eukaryotic-like serine/threonine-protein kinase
MSEGDRTDLTLPVRAAAAATALDPADGVTRVGLRRGSVPPPGAGAAPPAIDRFLIEEKIGSGGMGVVYRARDPEGDRLVALKVLDRAAEAEPERFAREARILASLRHPAIVRHVAHGHTAAGQAFLAMEWLDGEDLSVRLRRQGLTMAEAVQLGQRLAGALAEAHARGVVHRDLKPANVFLPGGRLDRAVLIDFGVAQTAFASARLTRSGAIVGTPSYMSPE